ncbi:MAG: hypothetical protein WBP28_03130, partial [Nostocoides sp.]
MNALKLGWGSGGGVSAADLERHSSALSAAITTGGAQLDPELAARAAAVAAKVAERQARSGSHT